MRPASLVILGTGLILGTGCLNERTPMAGQRPVVELIPLGARAPKDERGIITENDYRHELARIRLDRDGATSASPLSPELKEAVLSRMIDRRLLSIEALRQRVRASTTAVARELLAMRASLPAKAFEKQLIQTYQTEADLQRTIEERLVATQLLKQEAFAMVKVSEEDVRQRWETMPEEEKVRPARVHAAQILLRTEEEGLAVVAELKKAKGQNFGQLARDKSVAPEAERDGDLGWFESGVMPTIFDELCFTMNPGDISDLTASEYGFHIFRVIEVEQERPLTYEEARPLLTERLREERVRTAETSYLESLRSRVRVVKNEELLAPIE